MRNSPSYELFAEWTIGATSSRRSAKVAEFTVMHTKVQGENLILLNHLDSSLDENGTHRTIVDAMPAPKIPDGYEVIARDCYNLDLGPVDEDTPISDVPVVALHDVSREGRIPAARTWHIQPASMMLEERKDTKIVCEVSYPD